VIRFFSQFHDVGLKVRISVYNSLGACRI